ncbi:MAG: GTP-binding protein, partial [Candidatus Thorarchaeota archaeon]|nr:GTP-binding protein [Candidatus Thorarchaeota archaeon]
MTVEVYKVLVIGPPNAGKTSLVTRFTESDFEESYAPTVGLSVKVSRLTLPEGLVTMTVMDLGGQDSFEELRRGYYRGAHYVIFLYDMTDASTFANIPRWYEKMCEEICTESGGFFPGAIVANKADLAENRSIDANRGRQLANLLNLDYFETSAKTGENVGELFIHAASQCH